MEQDGSAQGESHGPQEADASVGRAYRSLAWSAPSHAPWGLASVLVGLLAFPACHDEPVPFTGQVSRSSYFEYHEQTSEALCPGLLPLLDKHAEMIGGLLGVPLVAGEPLFRYYRYRDIEAYGEAFPESGGKTSGTSIYSPSYFSAHELVHAYVHRARGNGPTTSLLGEGIAVALSCEPVGTLAQGSYDWRDFLHFDGASRVGYGLAGHFATYLLRRYGTPAFMQFFQASPDTIEAADLEAQFARFYPTSLDLAWREATDIPSLLSMTEGCLGDWACWTTGPLVQGEQVTQDCSNGMHRSLDVGPGEGGVMILKSGGDVAVWRSCWEDSGPYLVLHDYLDLPTLHWVVMAPGSYTLTSSGQTTLSLIDHLPATTLGETCDTAAELQLDGERVTQLNLPSTDGISGWVRLAGAVGRVFEIVPEMLVLSDGTTGSVGGTVSYCDGCDPGAACVALRPGLPQSFFVAPGSALRLTNLDARGGSLAGAGLWFHPVLGAGNP